MYICMYIVYIYIYILLILRNSYYIYIYIYRYVYICIALCPELRRRMVRRYDIVWFEMALITLWLESMD